MKRDLARSQSTLEKSYKPITEPLKELTKVYYKTTPDIEPTEISYLNGSLNKQSYNEMSCLSSKYGESFFEKRLHQ